MMSFYFPFAAANQGCYGLAPWRFTFAAKNLSQVSSSIAEGTGGYVEISQTPPAPSAKKLSAVIC